MSNHFAILNIVSTGYNGEWDEGHDNMFFIKLSIWKHDTFSNVKSQSVYIDPNEPISYFTKQFFGLTGDIDFSSKPNLVTKGWLNNCLGKLATKNIPVIGWNILEILTRHVDSLPENLTVIDLKNIASAVLPLNELGTLSMSSCLAYLYPETYTTLYTTERGEELIDNLAAQNVEILQGLENKLNIDTLDKIIIWYAQPHLIKFMPFGKYAGRSFEQIANHDPQYLIWLSTCKDRLEKDKDLKHTLHLMMQ